MRKFTAAEVLASEPDLTPGEVAEVVQMLNEEPVPCSCGGRWRTTTSSGRC